MSAKGLEPPRDRLIRTAKAQRDKIVHPSGEGYMAAAEVLVREGIFERVEKGAYRVIEPNTLTVENGGVEATIIAPAGQNILDIIRDNTFVKQPDGSFATKSGMRGKASD